MKGCVMHVLLIGNNIKAKYWIIIKKTTMHSIWYLAFKKEKGCGMYSG